MAFGQASGPPASKRQLDQLLSLLRDAGHTDFRDARGPMGFTQRQAAGKFTIDEAAGFIRQLEDEAFVADATAGAGAAGAASVADRPVPQPKLSAAEQALRRMPDGVIAAELQRRGWIVVEP
jgi:hypothetical protein